MLDSVYEDSSYTGWFDLESDLSENSSVDSAIKLGVIVSVLSANQIQTRYLVHVDNSIAGPASNRDTKMGNAPLEGTGPDKGEDFLESQTQPTPRSKSTPLLLCHRSSAMGRGRRVRREGVKNSTVARDDKLKLKL